MIVYVHIYIVAVYIKKIIPFVWMTGWDGWPETPCRRTKTMHVVDLSECSILETHLMREFVLTFRRYGAAHGVAVQEFWCISLVKTGSHTNCPWHSLALDPKTWEIMARSSWLLRSAPLFCPLRVHSDGSCPLESWYWSSLSSRCFWVELEICFKETVGKT